jgi:single-strand DNA-binding protein
MNHCTFIGNITRDIDLKYLPSGKAVCELGLALNHKWTDDKGVKREDVTFIDCVAYGRTAEVLGEYSKKGDKIALQCRVKQETWDDKQTGQKRSKLKFVIDAMELLGQRRAEGGQERPANQPPQRPAGRQKPPSDPDLDPGFEDDQPF